MPKIQIILHLMQSYRSQRLGMNKENAGVSIQSKTTRLGTRLLSPRNIQNIVKTIEADDIVTKKPAKNTKPFKTEVQVDKSRTQLAEPFQDNILNYLKSKQSQHIITEKFMERQKEISDKMRAMLVDWLVDVNIKFKLSPEVLYSTVNTIDRYLAAKHVAKCELQLLGVAALMIQGKYEEIRPPKLKDYMAVCDNYYSKEDIVKMEASILSVLHFSLTQPSTYYFLQLVHQKLHFEPKPFVFVRYILETVLLEASSVRFTNLGLVAGAVFLVNKIFNREKWSCLHTMIFSVGEKEAKECAKELHGIMHHIDSSSLTAVKRKFAASEYFEVSKYRVEKVSQCRN